MGKNRTGKNVVPPDKKALLDAWGTEASKILRSAMVRNGVTYEALSRMLNEAGYQTTPEALKNAISKGTFRASWFLLVQSTLAEASGAAKRNCINNDIDPA